MLTVALIHGNAVGGGSEIATACDFRLMHPDARIGFVQVHILKLYKRERAKKTDVREFFVPSNLLSLSALAEKNGFFPL